MLRADSSVSEVGAQIVSVVGRLLVVESSRENLDGSPVNDDSTLPHFSGLRGTRSNKPRKWIHRERLL